MALPSKKTPSDFPFKHSGSANEFGASKGGDYAAVQADYDARAIYNQDQINEVLDGLNGDQSIIGKKDFEENVDFNSTTVFKNDASFIDNAIFSGVTDFYNVNRFRGLTQFIGTIPVCDAAPTAADQLTRKDYVDDNFVDKSTNQTIGGEKTFSEIAEFEEAIVNGNLNTYDEVFLYGNAPTNSNHATPKSYVDDAILGGVNEKTISSTLLLTDAGDFLKCTNGTAITFTVPPNSSVAFPIGTKIEIMQYGLGAVNFAFGVGVTIKSFDGNLEIAGENAVATLKKIDTDIWVLFGSIA